MIKNGDIFNLNCGSIATVTNYIDSHNIEIITETGYKTTAESGQLRKGQVYDKLLRKVYGVGYMGIGKYCRGSFAYSRWTSMLERCYSEKYQNKFPSYIMCTVSDRWHDLQNFGKWFDNNYIEDYHLDKDLLLPGNKIYSENTCIFIPQDVNSFLKISKNQDNYYTKLKRKKLAKLIEKYPEYCDILNNYLETQLK